MKAIVKTIYSKKQVVTYVMTCLLLIGFVNFDLVY